MGYTNSPLVVYTNLTKNKTSNRKYPITRFTPHVIVGQCSAKNGVDYFATTDRQCSSNYVIGKDGEVGLSVEEKDRSWCSSSSDNDHRAITVEVASDTTEPYAVTDAAWDGLVKLAIDVCKRNGKKKLLWLKDKTTTLNYKPKDDEMVITVHRWFANKSCPGNYIYGRLDELAETVTKALSTPKPLTVEQKWAVEKGLFKGYGNGDFGWDDPLTRGQAAILFKRFYDLMKKVG